MPFEFYRSAGAAAAAFDMLILMLVSANSEMWTICNYTSTYVLFITVDMIACTCLTKRAAQSAGNTASGEEKI